MTITVETIASLTPVGYAVTACALSGDWVVGADNVGTSLLRYNIATDTAYETTSWRSGAQTLSSCAVRPNGNVCFFRYGGQVYEVDPTDGTTTNWSVGNLGHPGYRQVVTVGDVAYFGGYGIGGAGTTIYAVKLDMNTRTRTQLSSVGTGSSAWYAASVADDDGHVWLTRPGAAPWRITVSSDAMSQPIGSSMSGEGAPAAPFRFGPYIWHGSSTVNKITQIDPATDTMTLLDTVTGSPGSITANSRVIQAHDRGDGTVQAIVRRTSGGTTYAGGMHFTPNGAVVDESTADGGWWSAGTGAWASVSQGRYIYTWIGASLHRLTFNSIAAAQRIGLGWMVA